jgi:fructose-specific phosphotransferase system IIA component
MTISELLDEKVVKVDLRSRTKHEVLEEMVSLLEEAGKIRDKKKVLDAILKREDLMSTGIGNGVAIPHAKIENLNGVLAAFGKSEAGIDFDALDAKPVHLIFLLIVDEAVHGGHVKILARISRLLKRAHFRKTLKKASTPQEILRLIQQEEVYF